MNTLLDLVPLLWHDLIWPLIRLTCLVSLGLVVANFIEALNWGERLAVLARPLVRAGRFSATTGTSFTMAFFSGVSANTMLAEAYDKKTLGRTELVLANLFNSVPRFFLHLPTVFFLALPLIKGAALHYVGLTFAAALLQTLLVVGLGRFLLARPTTAARSEPPPGRRNTMRNAWDKSVQRFKKRIPRLLRFTVPAYVLFYLASRSGLFERLEGWLAGSGFLLAWLKPKALGIVVLQVSTEFSAGLAAAGGLLEGSSLARRDVILALLAGTVLAAPIRAVRHQFPYYVGIFPAGLAVELVGYSQLCRLASLVAVGAGYFFLTL